VCGISLPVSLSRTNTLATGRHAYENFLRYVLGYNRKNARNIQIAT
jgi:hypothetical protein